MKPGNKSRRKNKTYRADNSKLLAFKLKRADCQDAGIEFPWQTYAAMLYDVECAVEITYSDMIMAEVLADAHAEALIAAEAQHAQELVNLMSEEIQARRVFAAHEVFSPEEDFSLDERDEFVSVPSWSGMHITSRP